MSVVSIIFGIFRGLTNVSFDKYRLPLGALGLLQVENTHKRKGFGSLVVKLLSKFLAENNIEVTAPVVVKNVASRSMFEKLGFKEVDKVYWQFKL